VTPDALKQIFIDLKVRKLNDGLTSIHRKLRANIDVLDATLLEL
jgi:chorismate mutase